MLHVPVHFFLLYLVNVTLMKLVVGEVRKLSTVLIFYNFLLLRAEFCTGNGPKNVLNGSEFREDS